MAKIWRYVVVVSNPAHPAGMVKRLFAVVDEKSKEDVMTVADWLREQGREEGRREARREDLLKLLRARFGEVPETAAVRVKKANNAQLDTWLDRILSAPTLEDVLAGA